MVDFIVFFGGGFILFLLIVNFSSDSEKKESKAIVDITIQPNNTTPQKKENSPKTSLEIFETNKDKDKKEAESEEEKKKIPYEYSELAKYKPTPSTDKSLHEKKSIPKRDKKNIPYIPRKIKNTTPKINTLRQEKNTKVARKDLTPLKKNNWQEFKVILESNGITKLYHFTDKSNISSIRNNGGLYSWYTSKQKKISINSPGGDELSKQLDTRYGLENYVRLCFTKNHPMMYVAKNQGRISTPVILEIDVEVVYWNETRFSNMNATKTGHQQGEELSDLQRIKFPIVKQKNHFNVDDDEKHYYQAEVMVKKFIPLKYIINLNNF